MVATASTEHSIVWSLRLLRENASACVSCGFRLRNAHNARNASDAIAFEWKPGFRLSVHSTVEILPNNFALLLKTRLCLCVVVSDVNIFYRATFRLRYFLSLQRF